MVTEEYIDKEVLTHGDVSVMEKYIDTEVLTHRDVSGDRGVYR